MEFHPPRSCNCHLATREWALVDLLELVEVIPRISFWAFKLVNEHIIQSIVMPDARYVYKLY
jgi:hypothetical protein